MKMNSKSKMKRVLLTVCGLLAVAAISVGATIAYLTDSAVANNTFTVGHVNITLDEQDTDDSSGGKRDHKNEYHLIPGETYVKDPTIHVTEDSEDCWLFAKVENGIAKIEAQTEQTEDGYKNIADQITANGWTLLEGVDNVYYKSHAKADDPDVAIFESFKISGNVKGKDLSDYKNENITITGYAVQKAGFDTATAAWEETFGK